MSTKNTRRVLAFAGATALSASILVGGSLVAPTGRDLTFSLGTAGHVSIGAVETRGSLWGAAIAQTADAVALDNVVLTLDGATYRMPRIEFTGASLSRGDLSALFGKGSSEPPAARLVRLSARQIRIPELVVEQRMGNATQRATYRDVVASDVANGRIGTLASPGGSFEVPDADGAKATGTFGRITLDGFDLAQAVRLYTETGGPQAEMRTIYGAFAVEAIALKDPKGVEIKIARASGADFAARPTAQGWAQTMALMEAAGDDATEEQKAKLLRAFADLFGSFQFRQADIIGFEVRDPSDGENTVGRIARIAFTGGPKSEARVEGFEVTSDDGRARIGTIAFTGYSFDSTLEGLRALAEKPADSLGIEDLRRLVPTVGTMRLSGLEFDLPNEADEDDDADGGDATSPQRIRFTVGNVEVTADRPLNGIPTNLSMAVDSLALPVPADTEDEQLKRLAALGYTQINMSWSLAANWNEAGNEILIREVSLKGVDMGSVTLRGTLAGVTRDAFNADTAVATVALLGATAKSLDLTVENRGLLERVVRTIAKEQGRTPEQVRTEWGATAMVGVPALLGNSPNAKTVGQAVARFVAKPGTLSVSARAKDPAGIGVADFATMSKPTDLLRKIELTATAK